MIVKAITAVHADEPVYQLAEVEKQGPDGRGFHRYQIMLIRRDGDWAEFCTDLGPAANFTADQFCVLTLWEHTVGEARDIADRMRFDRLPVGKEIERRDMVGDWLLWEEERWRRQANRSTFGFGGQVVR